MSDRRLDAQEALVTLGRSTVHVRDTGGDGPPVLLINGIGAHTRMWGHMERVLSGSRVISFDAPGAGQSPTPRGPVSVHRLAALTAAVLDHVRVDQADAVGYSMGGLVLQQLLADHPARVRRAVLLATSPGLGGLYGPATSLLNVSTPARFLSSRLYLRTVGDLVGGRARTDPAWIAAKMPARLAYPPSMRGYTQQVLALSGWSGLGLLQGIPHPVLVINGDDDPLTPVSNGKLLAHLLPHARLRVAVGEGHMMPLDDRSSAPGWVRDFLAAPELTEAPVWQDAEVVGAQELRAALGRRSLQWQPMPWGPISAIVRRRHLGPTRAAGPAQQRS